MAQTVMFPLVNGFYSGSIIRAYPRTTPFRYAWPDELVYHGPRSSTNPERVSMFAIAANIANYLYNSEAPALLYCTQLMKFHNPASDELKSRILQVPQNWPANIAGIRTYLSEPGIPSKSSPAQNPYMEAIGDVTSFACDVLHEYGSQGGYYVPMRMLDNQYVGKVLAFPDAQECACAGCSAPIVPVPVVNVSPFKMPGEHGHVNDQFESQLWIMIGRVAVIAFHESQMSQSYAFSQAIVKAAQNGIHLVAIIAWNIEAKSTIVVRL